MALLGDDGRGYELARKLEGCGVWRSWLGESNYSNFAPFLSSPSAWEAFMRTDDSKTRAQIQLQLRARALLFDKLHSDDVYFSLEDDSQDPGVQQQEGSAPINSIHSKGARHDDLPESWYKQFAEKFRASRQLRLSFGDRKLPLGEREAHKRTPEEMSTYLMLIEKHKRRRQAFKEDRHMGFGNSIWENGSNMRLSVSDGNDSVDDETSLLPEVLFPSNCVPDSALPPATRVEDNQKVEFYGVLDSLPHVMTRSPAMIERFGIRPEYLKMGLGRSKYRGKNGLDENKKPLGQDQVSRMCQRVIARMLENVGFEGVTEVPMEVLSQCLSCHISKLGRILKVLTDNYRKQCSAMEILKMFLQTVGYNNLGTLVDHVKDGTRTLSHQAQQHARGLQPQPGFQSQHQNSMLQSQQIPRQMHPQMQMVHNQNLAFQQQQQWERMRRRQPSTPRSGTTMEKERSMVEVKIESQTESPIDGNAFTGVNHRHPQMQFRQQQMAAFANLHNQSSNQFKQLSSLQIPQLQTQNMATIRAPPVKVEGFQELMGGDAALKHDSEEHKLTSPPK
ncbi:PREDICTED: uncharacterized protein LOC104611936 isoform X2 [Nelumbo nucifera]|uniref:Bromodomain associated domain-containing protein n=2 Tax=Nelumbo nucifera TaxID=4432 RepID=A0A822XKN3_NELNU|nr:PREDICTED: uncharacterized protein LOC104611936 isoform X2 [Nelumbo nucifera]DAD22144.1 TPA_asm: hypothetical protein HUJ06_023607 [Nelumbo nucifera]